MEDYKRKLYWCFLTYWNHPRHLPAGCSHYFVHTVGVAARFQASRGLSFNNPALSQSAHGDRAPSSQQTTMTDSGPKFKIFKFVKIIISSFVIIALLLFTTASIRTLSLDVNVGLQLAHWEKTNNISLVIDHHQREELLANFKGNFRLLVGEV